MEQKTLNALVITLVSHSSDLSLWLLWLLLRFCTMRVKLLILDLIHTLANVFLFIEKNTDSQTWTHSSEIKRCNSFHPVIFTFHFFPNFFNKELKDKEMLFKLKIQAAECLEKIFGSKKLCVGKSVEICRDNCNKTFLMKIWFIDSGLIV